MSKATEMFICKKCGETKPLEGFYTNSKVNKNKPYQLVCRKCYQATRKARESGSQKNTSFVNNTKSKTETQTINPVSSNPTQLTCSIKHFHQFIGPKVRRDIQVITRREKQRLNSICQNCGKKAELEAAHNGNDRIQIINAVLKKHLIDKKQQIIQVDLNKVINEILEAHKPLSQHFIFLCSECHRKYDNESK